MRLLFSAALVLLLCSGIAGLISCSKPEAKNEGVDRYNRGVAYMEEGEYDNAINEFNAALRADPNFFEARKNLAGAYVYENNWQAARRNYELALEIRPDDASIYANLALVHKHLGEREIAWDNIELALAADPTYPLVHYRAGELFQDAGDLDQARAAFGDVLKYETPGSRLAFDAQDQIDFIDYPDGAPVPEEDLLEPEPEDPEEEIEDPDDPEENPEEEPEDEIIEEDIEDVIEEDPEDPEEDEILDNDIEFGLEGDTDDVIEEEDDTSDESDETDESDESSDETDEDEGDESDEEEIVLPVLTGDELYQDRLGRGRQMRAIGSTAAAIRLLLEAYEVHPDYAVVNYELALAYLSDGQTDLGVTYLEKYIGLETDPDLKAQAQERLAAVQSSF